jgi:cephalosporin hydroxylase
VEDLPVGTPGYFKQIDGWFGRHEQQFYEHQVAIAASPARFVEVGSWMGRSSTCMAEAIRNSGKQIDFWCVDTWRGSEEHQQFGVVREDALFQNFLTNIAPFRDFIQPLRMSSLEAATTFDSESLDFVFLDAAHDFANVVADIEAWLPKVRPTGVIAGHDYLSCWPGVVQAVEAKFGARPRVFGPCWYVPRDGSRLTAAALRDVLTESKWWLRRLLRTGAFRRVA